MNQAKKAAVRVWGMSLLLGGFVAACSAESGDGESTPAGYSVQHEQDGSVGVTRNTGELAAQNSSPADAQEEKAGCVHIRYCNNGNPVICDIDNHNCTVGAIINECIGDANYVCGRDWSYMRIVD